MTLTLNSWRLKLLGQTGLFSDDSSKEILERKLAALLCLLALEGAQTRSKLAGLLWANSTEQTARNNLAQLLKRLKDFTGEPIVQGDAVLRLVNTKTDALELEEQIFAAKYQSIKPSVLLNGYDFEDCPDFLEWLMFQRERLNQMVLQAMVSYSSQLEQQQQIVQALEIAEQVLVQDNVSESSYRRIMRLQYILGNRNAALKTFALCTQTLARELGVQPSSDTLNLKNQIETDEILPSAPQKPELPISVLRPKQLIGRESAWLAMQEAKAEHKAIFISAASGMGKTRLIQDFTRQATTFKSRPGDQNLAYSSLARVYSTILEDFQLELPDWVRLEVSRVVPHLRQTSDTVAALQSQADQLRFYQAAAELNLLAIKAGMGGVIVDDLQFMDTASFEVAKFVLSQLDNTTFDVLMAYRIDELSPEIALQLEQLIKANLAVKIELEPFTLSETQAFIDSLDLNVNLEPNDLQNYTNGNPLYMLESIRYCLETGQALHQAPRIKQLIQQRLENLTDKALRLAQVAAILSTDFTLEHAAKILEQPIFEIASTLEQLETAQIMNGENFVHDLIFEAINASVSAGVKRHLHRQIAKLLSSKKHHNATRIAEHYLAGGEDTQAIPYLLIDAELAKSNYRNEDACKLFSQAAQLDIQLGNSERAFESTYLAADIALNYNFSASMQALIVQLFELATTGEQQAKAYYLKAECSQNLGQHTEVETLARLGLDIFQGSQNTQLKASLYSILSSALWAQGRTNEAIPIQKQVIVLNQETNSALDLATSYANLGSLYYEAQDYASGSKQYELALKIRCQQPDEVAQAQTRINFASGQAQLGNARSALEHLQLANQLLKKTQGTTIQMIQCLAEIGQRQQALGQFQTALGNIQQAIILAESIKFWALPIIQSHETNILLILGQLEQVQEKLEIIETNTQLRPAHQLGIIRQRIVLRNWLQQDITSQIKLVKKTDAPMLVKQRILLETLQALPPKEQTKLVSQHLQAVQATKSLGWEILAQTKFAQVFQTTNHQAAINASSRATELYEHYQPITYCQNETLLTHHQVLKANQDKNALEPLQQALELITAQQKALPLEYQETFFAHNPINKAILEAVKQHGIN